MDISTRSQIITEPNGSRTPGNPVNMAEDCEDDKCKHRNLELLYRSNHYDCVLKCQGKKFKVHRAILEMESDYFKAMFSGPWKENADGIVHLDSTESDVLEQGLRCLYARTTAAVDKPYRTDLHFNILLYLFFDSYLAGCARRQSYQDCHALLDGFQPRLKQLNSLQDLSHIVGLVLSNTRRADTDLRPTIIQFCAVKFLSFGYHRGKEPIHLESIDWSLIEPDYLKCPKSSTASASSTASNSHKDKKRARQLLNDIIEVLEAEEPLAWKLALSAVWMKQSYQEQVAAEKHGKNALSGKIRELQRAKDKAELSSRLLRRHTHCRRVECGARLDLADLVFDPDGNLIELRCKLCNTKHRKA